MTGRQRLRRLVNWLNLTTLTGFVVAWLGGSRPRRPRGALYVAPGYRARFPVVGAFTVGHVVSTPHAVHHVLDDAALLRHESRHVTQYAWLGPLFWPAYGLAAAFSRVVSGHPASHNPFETGAGLADGGYTRRPLRGWLRWSAQRTDAPP
jgi:hypothetical protein